MRTLKEFLLMLQFFTRIPINLNLPCEKDNFRRGTIFFPIVGLLIGALQWIVFYLLQMRLPAAAAAVISIIILVALTGALHLDGLGDTCDGFFAFKGRDRIIEIMKDSRIGTYACIAIITDLMLRLSCMSALSGFKDSLIIIAAPVVGRTIFVLMFFIGKPAKESGSGNLFIGNTGVKELITAFFIGIIITVLLMGAVKAVFIFAAAAVAAVLFNRYCVSKIGGLTGDTLGAGNEIAELLTFIVFLIIK